MIRSVVRLFAVDLSYGKKIYNDLIFEWPIIDGIIDDVYSNGGSVELSILLEDTANVQVYYPRDKLWMAANPGRFILAAFPFSEDGKQLSSRHWEKALNDGDLEPFTFNDDVFESNWVCKDIVIAKELFKELFLAHKVTDVIMEKMVSSKNRDG